MSRLLRLQIPFSALSTIFIVIRLQVSADTETSNETINLQIVQRDLTKKM